MENGYIKLWRRLQFSKIWVGEKFTRGQAWVDLMMLANHKDGGFRLRGIWVEVKRGQIGYSAESLAARWLWSRGRVLRFLSYLETVQQITQQKSKLITIISIVNYDSYQGSEQQSDAKVNTTNKIINKIINKAPFEKPTVLDLETYFLEKKVSPIVAKNEAEKFLDYYTTVDWVVGKNKKQMTNWKTAASGWNTRRVQREKNTGYQSKSAAARTAENIAAEFGSGDSS